VDEAAHLWIPATCLVAEVDSGLQQLFDADVSHCSTPFEFGFSNARRLRIANLFLEAGREGGPSGSGFRSVYFVLCPAEGRLQVVRQRRADVNLGASHRMREAQAGGVQELAG
jgi:hypothetical protein